MSEPFHVAVGMVLQRNGVAFPHFADGDPFLATLGLTDTRWQHLEVTGLWDEVVKLSPLGRHGDELWIVRDNITAEWFIPD